jgi:ribosomal protein S18 acetylase RimI-like enzyme
MGGLNKFSMNIRITVPDDWQKFREIRLMGMNTDPQAFGGDLTEEKNRKEPQWRERLGSPERLFYIAEEGDRFVSMAGAKKIADKRWLLVGVYTRPEYRGKGLARQLIEKVITELQHKGVDAIRLMVNIDQKDAVHLYEKLDFKIVKTLKDEKMTDGSLHDEYLMEKGLI